MLATVLYGNTHLPSWPQKAVEHLQPQMQAHYSLTSGLKKCPTGEQPISRVCVQPMKMCNLAVAFLPGEKLKCPTC